MNTRRTRVETKASKNQNRVKMNTGRTRMDNENRIRRNIHEGLPTQNTKVQGVAVTVTSSRFLLQILSFILRCCFV